MADISPFSALRYNTEKVSLSNAVSPPYDIINRQQRRGYLKNSEYNITKVVLPERRNKHRDYNKAKRDFYGWIRAGVLKKDSAPGIYVYVQEYKIGKRTFSCCGILSLLRLEGSREKTALPHEKIFQGPLIDRVNLMKKTKAHLSPIFIIFRDSKRISPKLFLNAIKYSKPEADITFEGIRHKLWTVRKRPFIERLAKLMRNSKTFIADGHHRFEASLAVRDYFSSRPKQHRGANGYNYTLVYLISSKDKGLSVLPVHRAVKVLPKEFNMDYMFKRLSGYFKVKSITGGEVESSLRNAAGRKACAFVIYYKNSYIYLLLKEKGILRTIGPKKSSLRWRNLDVSILHNLIFSKLLGIKESARSHRNIYYYRDPKELLDKVKSGKHRLGVFLNPTRIEEVEKIAEAGERMPHKSTYFYPKPLTGLVIHKF